MVECWEMIGKLWYGFLNLDFKNQGGMRDKKLCWMRVWDVGQCIYVWGSNNEGWTWRQSEVMEAPYGSKVLFGKVTHRKINVISLYVFYLSTNLHPSMSLLPIPINSFFFSNLRIIDQILSKDHQLFKEATEVIY